MTNLLIGLVKSFLYGPAFWQPQQWAQRLRAKVALQIDGVARRHAEVSRRMFPGYEVHAVTNGVHDASICRRGVSALTLGVKRAWRAALCAVPGTGHRTLIETRGNP